MCMLLFGVDGLAVDWATDKLYWTDAELRRIGVFDLTNYYYNRELISTGTDSIPRAIVVDPQNRYDKYQYCMLLIFPPLPK